MSREARALAGDSEAGAAAEDRVGLSGWLRSEAGEVGAESVVDLAGDVALEAAHDLALGFALARTAVEPKPGCVAVAQATD